MDENRSTPEAVKLTPSQENYLEWIYRFSKTKTVRVRDIAQKLGVRLPSVSRAVSGLKEAGLVEHESYGDIVLTIEGTRIGEEIVRRDRCLTRLLVNVLEMNPQEADTAVHQMEHVLPVSVLQRLEILIDVAETDEAFLARLRGRFHSIPSAPAGNAGQVGQANVHAGLAREKHTSST